MTENYGYECKHCGGVSPVGVGYVATPATAAASAAATACPCGMSVAPAPEPVPAAAADAHTVVLRDMGGPLADAPAPRGRRVREDSDLVDFIRRNARDADVVRHVRHRCGRAETIEVQYTLADGHRYRIRSRWSI